MLLFALSVLALPDTRYRWRHLPVGESPVLAVASATKGKRVFVANGLGFAIRDLVSADPIPMEQVTGIALGDYAPDTVVAVGKATKGGNVRFSLDGGENWRPCPTTSTLEGGSISISSTGHTWVWSGLAGTKRTEDYGFTWSDCDGLPVGSSVVADRTSTRQFYAIADGKLYISSDGAKSFEQRDLALPDEDAPKVVVPTPGRVGDLWLLAGANLYRSLPGQAFQRVPRIISPIALSFGLAGGMSAPGPLRLAMFLTGRVEGRSGLFRSDDEGVSWSYLSGAPENIRVLAGVQAHAGRIFAAPHGGGVWVGDLR